MGKIFEIFFLVFMAIVGGDKIYLIISLPAVIIWKIYRCIRYGYRITD